RLFDQRAACLNGPLHHLGQLYWLTPEFDVASVDATQVHEIVNQSGQVLNLPFDKISRPLQIRCRRTPHLEDLDRIPYWSQRVSQLMGQCGQKLVLASIGFTHCMLSLLTVCNVHHSAAHTFRLAGLVESVLAP